MRLSGLQKNLKKVEPMLKKVVAFFLAVGVLSCAGVPCLAMPGSSHVSQVVDAHISEKSNHSSGSHSAGERTPSGEEDEVSKKGCKLSKTQLALIIGGSTVVVAGAAVGIAANSEKTARQKQPLRLSKLQSAIQFQWIWRLCY